MCWSAFFQFFFAQKYFKVPFNGTLQRTRRNFRRIRQRMLADQGTPVGGRLSANTHRPRDLHPSAKIAPPHRPTNKNSRANARHPRRQQILSVRSLARSNGRKKFTAFVFKKILDDHARWTRDHGQNFAHRKNDNFLRLPGIWRAYETMGP